LAVIWISFWIQNRTIYCQYAYVLD